MFVWFIFDIVGEFFNVVGSDGFGEGEGVGNVVWDIDFI